MAEVESKKTITSELTSSETPQMKIRVLQWNPIGIWTPKIACDDFQCSICKKKTTSKCGDCTSSKNIATQDCQIAQGTCGHGYHYHCIYRWLNSGSQQCPICRIPWNYKFQNIEKVKNSFISRIKNTNKIQSKTSNVTKPNSSKKIQQVD